MEGGSFVGTALFVGIVLIWIVIQTNIIDFLSTVQGVGHIEDVWSNKLTDAFYIAFSGVSLIVSKRKKRKQGPRAWMFDETALEPVPGFAQSACYRNHFGLPPSS